MTSSIRRWSPLVAILLAALPSADARADSKRDAEKKACADAYTSAQQLRNQRKLVSAREQLLVCARDVCPSVLSGDCARWLNEVDQSTPSIVLLAQDASGAAIVDAKATVDGKPLATKLDGRATPVDPGQHTIRVEAAQGAKEESLVVAEGEKNRKIVVTLGAAAPASTQTRPSEEHHEEASPKKPTPAIAWVLAGVGVVGLGSFAAFGLMGNKQASDDRAAGGCKPNCSSEEVSSIKTKYLVADVSLGVGVISAAIATYLFVSSSGSAESSQSAKVHVDVAPAKGGGAFSLAGSF